MRLKRAAIISVVLLAGCAGGPRWYKDGASAGEEEKAEAACKTQADEATPDDAAGVARMQTLMAICMDSHGWSERQQ
jgi:hypothetical protein